jgi:general secretion pathway protein A
MSEFDVVNSNLLASEPGLESEVAPDVLAVMGLREPPFAENVSDVYFFPSQQHLRALGFIGQLLWSRTNLAVITGADGIGKSLLIRRLLGDLDDRVLLAHVQCAAAEPQEFLREVLKQFGMELNEADRTDRRRLLSRFLTHQFNQNRLCLLAVESVHTLKPAVLEELRFIGELAVEGKRMVKLLLLGGHALNHIVDSPRMTSLTLGRAPRIGIENFSEDQVAAYIAHRLRAAGAIDADALAPPTLTPQIHRYTAGVPRSINQLCERAMSVASRLGEVRLSMESLKDAAESLSIIPTANRIEAIADAGPGEAKDEQALLLVTSQGLADGVVPLVSSRILIGRSELADVRIESAFVSRYHSLIVRENGYDILIDLGSTNGVLVNGKRVVRAQLKHRDLIQVGPARVTYLNPTHVPPLEGDASETLTFARPGMADPAQENAVMAFGRFDEAG